MLTTSPFHPHYSISRRLLRSRLQPVKVAITCLASCLALSGTSTVDGRPAETPAPLKEFAGHYNGDVSFTQSEKSLIGSADAVVRGKKVGGTMRLNASFDGDGDPLVIARSLRFKRRSLNSISAITEKGSQVSAAGSGRATSKRKRIRYTDYFTAGGNSTPVQVVGEVRFLKRSTQVTETWTMSGEPFVLTYSLRRAIEPR